MSPPSIDDLRSRLAAQASRAEQRNRPRVLILGAAVLFAVGAWFAWDGFQRRSDASGQAAAAQRNAEATLAAASRLQGLIASTSGQDGPEPSEPTSGLLSRIEALGPRAGLKSRVPIGSLSTKPERSLGWNQVRATYTIRDESMNAILTWVNMVVGDIPGMEVHTITIRPEAAEWVVIVIFSRWEKAESGS